MYFQVQIIEKLYILCTYIYIYIHCRPLWTNLHVVPQYNNDILCVCIYMFTVDRCERIYMLFLNIIMTYYVCVYIYVHCRPLWKNLHVIPQYNNDILCVCIYMFTVDRCERIYMLFLNIIMTGYIIINQALFGGASLARNLCKISRPLG